MMKLPDMRLALVERGKITDYLLNPEHPGNGGKARFFRLLGFTQENWQALASALRKSAQTAETVLILESPHGRKYIQDGVLESLNKRNRKIRMVWIIDSKDVLPRLVTAYPRE